MAKSLLKLCLFSVIGLIALVFLGQIIFNLTYHFPQKINFGVTFSPQYTTYLGLDWKKVYQNMLSDLKVKELRLPTYWDQIEKEQGQFSFEDLDFMLDEAQKRGAKILLVVGAKQPRWPECQVPSWAKQLELKQRQAKTLEIVKRVVERYKDNKSVRAYQVENEPFLPFFGEDCDRPDKDFLKAEINLVRRISNKPIVISDSGELGNWILPMQLSDIFGTSLYRSVYNSKLGYTTYPVLPYLYNVKAQIVRDIFARSNKKTILVELQAEPWLGTADLAGDSQKQARLLPLEKLKDYLNYAKKTGFDSQYLWGVEWWYFMAQNGYPEYLDYAKTLFK